MTCVAPENINTSVAEPDLLHATPPLCSHFPKTAS